MCLRRQVSVSIALSCLISSTSWRIWHREARPDEPLGCSDQSVIRVHQSSKNSAIVKARAHAVARGPAAEHALVPELHTTWYPMDGDRQKCVQDS